MNGVRVIAIVGLLGCGSSSTSDPRDKPLPPQPVIKDGLRITYSTDIEAAVDAKADDFARELRLRTGDVERVRALPVPAGAIEIVLVDPTKKADVIAYVTKTFGATFESHACEPEEPRRVCMRLLPAAAERIKRAAMENAIEVIRRRFVATKVVGNVSASGDNLVVDLAPLDAEAMSTTRDLIARTAKLELFVVDNGSPIMKSLFAHASQDPGATAFEVKGEVDHTDFYLTAPDRSEALSPEDARRIGCYAHVRDPDGMIRCRVSGRTVLQRYLEQLARMNPAFAIPDDRRVGYEYIEPIGTSLDRRPFWRTYLLDRAATLTGSSIKRAKAAFDPNMNQPIVLIDLDATGAKAFEQLTRKTIGKKIAIVVDGRVKSAPIIMNVIPGGRISITMGGNQPERQQLEANTLATALASGALPSPVREESVVELKGGVPQPVPDY